MERRLVLAVGKMRASGRKARRVALYGVGGLIALILIFCAAIFAGSTIPANRDWTPPGDGVTIYVATNGVHSGLLLPAVNAQHDWRARTQATDIGDPRYAVADGWVLIGWGERDFFLNTPRWADVKLRYIVHAAIGSDSTLLHVEHYPRPEADMRPIRLTPTQYAALAAAIDADFAPGKAIAGYWKNDAFYPAHGRYSARRTCNEWTGARLRAVGVKVGIWTPASWSVMRWF